MTIAKGFLTICGVKKATTWNTPVAAGAGDGVEFSSESITGGADPIEDQAISGKSTQREQDAGPRTFAGDLVVPARYEGVEQVRLALAMATAGAPSTVHTSATTH